MAVDTKSLATAVDTTPEQKTLVGMINGSLKELAKALPKHLSPERMVRIATTCIRQNPRLAQCTPASFMGSLFVCAQMGLEPVAGLAHLVPFSNSKKINGQWIKVLECQLIIGYKGIAELFYRHEKSGMIDWGTVHEKDEFAYELGTNAFLKHKPAATERGKVIGYYCIYTLLNGMKKFNYMTHSECMDHGRKHSKTYDNDSNEFNKKSPWATSPDSMCLKTVMLQGSKTVPMSTELRRALDADETSREFKDGIADALDLPTTNWQEADAEKEITKADTSKIAAQIGSDPTPEEIEAKAAEAKARLHAEDEKPAGEATKAPADNDSGLAPEPKEIRLKGLIAAYYPPKGKGPASVYIQGEYAKTFDVELAKTLKAHKDLEEEIELVCIVEVNGQYSNNMIKELIAVH